MTLTNRELDQVKNEVASPLRDDLHKLDTRLTAIEERFEAFAQQTATNFGQLNTQLSRLVDLVEEQGKTLKEIRDKIGG